MRQVAVRAVQIAVPVALIALWYLATTRWGVSRILLPNPIDVVQALGHVLATGEYMDDLRVTLTELAIAFAISLGAGITLGYLISRSSWRIRVFEPLLAAIYAVPLILFLPLYVLWFGLGPPSKIALGATISFFPIGFTVALLSVIGSETIASLAGLGHRIVNLVENMDMARMFAYIVFVVAIAAILNTIVSRLEARSRWW